MSTQKVGQTPTKAKEGSAFAAAMADVKQSQLPQERRKAAASRLGLYGSLIPVPVTDEDHSDEYKRRHGIPVD